MSRDMCQHSYDRSAGPCPKCDTVEWMEEIIEDLREQIEALEDRVKELESRPQSETK